MEQLQVELGARSYPIYITDCFTNLVACIRSAGMPSKIGLITDSNVDPVYGGLVQQELCREGMEVHKYILPAGEHHKTLDTVKGIYEFLLESRFDRKAMLVALGGGVTGDITGFAAATYMRGIPFIQIPTTLLAQADSSVGGKTGVDFLGAKNIIGAFHQPALVYINVEVLKTLPPRELRSGLAETVKHGLIQDKGFIAFVEENLEKLLAVDTAAFTQVAIQNCTIKSQVVGKDEKEEGLRAILNFGHTFGHAIESMSGFTLTHGECVSIGICGAYRLARRMGMVEEAQVNYVEALLQKLALPVRHKLDVDAIFQQLFVDKKAAEGKLKFILPVDIGKVKIKTVEDHTLIRSVLTEIQ